MLSDFHTLSDDELMREIERMKHERIAKHYPSLLPPSASGRITNPLPACTRTGAEGDHFEGISA